MKILIALHQCMDLGGIINHTEDLIGGLQHLGHTVHLRELVWGNSVGDQRKDGNFIIGPSGIPHDQGKGWNFQRRQRITYRGPHVVSARQRLEQYDLIIWTVPVPPKNKNNLGNYDWPKLYDLPKEVKQIAFIHDGNAKRGNIHILRVAEFLSGIACVHPCAMGGADFIPVPRSMIFNPQDLSISYFNHWTEKSPGFVNMQTFKAWKHAHELIGAIRYMPPKEALELREVAGRGIEYQYLTSEDKCKDAYFHEDGERFWEAALSNGMEYHSYWDINQRNDFLDEARVLVDPSWSKSYSKIGGHFNRVAVEAMMHGCVVVAREMGMGNEVFKPGEHYIAIPQDADLQTYADIVLAAGNMQTVEAAHFRDNCLDLLPKFDRNYVAQQVIDLAMGDLDTTIGEPSKAQNEKASDLMFDYFGDVW